MLQAITTIWIIQMTKTATEQCSDNIITTHPSNENTSDVHDCDLPLTSLSSTWSHWSTCRMTSPASCPTAAADDDSSTSVLSSRSILVTMSSSAGTLSEGFRRKLHLSTASDCDCSGKSACRPKPCQHNVNWNSVVTEFVGRTDLLQATPTAS